MDKIIEAINVFEKENNMSVFFTLCGDGSMGIQEFWTEEFLFSGVKDLKLIEDFLNHTKVAKDENGLALSPTKILETTLDVAFYIKVQKEENKNSMGIIEKLKPKNFNVVIDMIKNRTKN